MGIAKWVGGTTTIDNKIFPDGVGYFYGKDGNGKKIEKKMMSFKVGNDFYTGECENGKPEGYGVAIFANADIYEGGWKNGKKDGDEARYYC
jgi:hypothetical protein